MSVIFDFFVSAVVYLTTVEIVQYVAVAVVLYSLVLILTSFMNR